MGIRVVGVGKGLPDRIVSNLELAAVIGVEPDWIQRRTGIMQRRIAGPTESASTLSCAAGRQAIASASGDIDAVIVGTSTPDFRFPPTAVLVQHELGLRSAIAFDVGAACSGFMHAFLAASSLIESGVARRALVVGVDLLSQLLDHEDPTTSAVFGDAGAAMVIESDPSATPVTFTGGSDGAHFTDVYVPAGGSRAPLTVDAINSRLDKIHMSGGDVFRFAVQTMTKMAEELDARSADLIVCHQANQRILAEVADRTGIDPSRFFMNVDRYGNTSAASVPLAVAEAHEAGRLNPGDQLVMIGLGAGYTWAGTRLEWTMARPPVLETVPIAPLSEVAS